MICRSQSPAGPWTTTMIVLCCSAIVPATYGDVDPAEIERITGLSVQHIPAQGVYKIARARADVPVRVDKQPFHPFRGLTSWAAFQDGKRAPAMVMGDIVLFQDEVNPAMSAALENGLTVTALHNHFFFDEPKVYFMHIGGEGSTSQLATGVRKVFDTVEKVRKATPTPRETFGYKPLESPSRISREPLEAILGDAAATNDGMIKFVFGRSVTMDCGCPVSTAMGINTWAVFAGTDEHAVVDGDFACLPGELQPTLRSLRKHGVNIVAIHNHMEEENPRVFFLHYWGVGSATRLAEAIRATLQAQRAASATPEP